jgi:serine protease Do
MEYMRGGKPQFLSVTLGQAKEQTARKSPSLGLTGNDESAGKLGIAVAPASRVAGSGEQGIVVLRVDPNGKAAEIGLGPGDIIVNVAGKEVTSPQDLTTALKEASAQKKQHVLALVRRNDREMFVALPVVSGS